MKEWDFLERIANELLQTLYQRMWFRSWDVYNEGWAVERIKNALKKAEELSWDDIGKRHIEVYEGCRK